MGCVAQLALLGKRKWPAPKSGVENFGRCGQGIPLLHDHSLGLLEAMIGRGRVFLVLFCLFPCVLILVLIGFVETLKNNNGRLLCKYSRRGWYSHWLWTTLVIPTSVCLLFEALQCNNALLRSSISTHESSTGCSDIT